MANDDSNTNVERRRHERAGKKGIVMFRRFEDLNDDRRDLNGELIDIGGGGIRFFTSEKLAEQTPLVIRLDLPAWSGEEDQLASKIKSADLGELKILGMVVRAEEAKTANGKYEIGVRFSGSIK